MNRKSKTLLPVILTGSAKRAMWIIGLCLAMGTAAGTANAQQTAAAPATETVTGKVTDSSGEPLPFVAVTLKNTPGVATQTDANGNFRLDLPSAGGKIFTLTYVGMKTRSFVWMGKPVIAVMESDNEIDEVVVTGYQTISRQQMTGAVTQLKADDVMLGAKFSLNQMLQGQVAGMAVKVTSGEPSATPKIRIRGTSSIYSSRSPLWVLDGIILDDPVDIGAVDLNDEDAAYLIGNAIAGVNPQDIESINVLKDAAAAAIYGVRAANGVIVVTTKKGHVGEPSVSYHGNVTLSLRESYNNLDMMNASERIRLSQDIINDGLIYSTMPRSLGYEGLYMKYLNKEITYDQFDSGVKAMSDNNTDWFDLLFRDSWSQNHSVSLSGGNANTLYYASLGYTNNQGTAIGSDSKRYTANAKISSWLNKKVYAEMQLLGSITENDGFNESAYKPRDLAINTARTIPAYDQNGDLYFYDTGMSSKNGIAGNLLKNYINERNTSGATGKISSINAKVNLKWQIIDMLKYEFVGSLIHQNTISQSWATDKSYYVSNIRGYMFGAAVPLSEQETNSAIPFGGILNDGHNEQTSFTLRNQLHFNKTIRNEHSFDVLAISELRSINATGLSGSYYGWQPDMGSTFATPTSQEYINKKLAPTITDNSTNYVSWIGVATYSFRNKFILNGNIRMDGSSNFGDNPEYRFLPCWSVAGKYNISDEKFISNIDAISYLAVRASYGIQGNIPTGTSPYMIMQRKGYNTDTSLPESNIRTLPNADLRWEKTRSYNFGLDMTLWEGRLSLTVDLYKKYTSDLFMPIQISSVYGTKTMTINGGKMNNSGVEAALGGAIVKNRDFNLGLTLIYSYNKNVLIEANTDPETIKTAQRLSGGKESLFAGEALGTIYSYRLAGLNHDTGMPYYYNKDGKSYSIVNDEQIPNYWLVQDVNEGLVRSGVLEAPHTGGIHINVGYKNLRFKTNFSYSFGGVKRLPRLFSDYKKAFDPFNNISKEINNRWRQPGDEKKANVIPRMFDSNITDALPRGAQMDGTYLRGITLYDNSDARVASTDNLRLNSVVLSYNIPNKLTKQVGVSNMMLSFEATNLWLLADSKWRGFDPELSSSANATQPKTFTFNLNITF